LKEKRGGKPKRTILDFWKVCWGSVALYVGVEECAKLDDFMCSGV